MRLHFTADDLGRITFASAPNALWETALSASCLRAGRAPGVRVAPDVGEWRRTFGAEAARRAGVLRELLQPDRFVPDFFLQPESCDLDTALRLASETPSERLATDLGLAAEPGWNGGMTRPGTYARELAAGSDGARRALAKDARRYFDTAVGPLWARIRADALTDRALRSEMLMRGGVDALLTTLGESWLWRAPTLHIPSPSSYDIPLCGRGLLLVPSWFAIVPGVMYRPRASTVLVYPMRHGDAPVAASDTLGALLGRTRATVLDQLRVPATTSGLAERVGVSLAAASQHAAVLRGAGLIDTARTGMAVLHTLTPLGQALLGGRG
ncbi:ArsR/SmtB family transcription factor [Streptomyces atratus]|uniref:ArsR/SmtB family transcription factor n=1 Tax=Streptomyces atratus TaxID=1893 RepID=UPI003401A423